MAIPLTMTKKELVNRLGISKSSLMLLLNVELYSKLEELGYKKRSHILTKKQLEYINEMIGIE